METRMADVKTEIIPYIYYGDVAAALDWLARAFGFKEEMRDADPQRRRAWRDDTGRTAHHAGSTAGKPPDDHQRGPSRHAGDIRLSRRCRRALRARAGRGCKDRQDARGFAVRAQLWRARPRRACLVFHDASEWGRTRPGSGAAPRDPSPALAGEGWGEGRGPCRALERPSSGASRHLLPQEREKGSPLRRG